MAKAVKLTGFNTNGQGPLQVEPGDTIQTNGGNARGVCAVDLQTSRTADTQVAAGNYSGIAGGLRNTVGGMGSSILGGIANLIETNNNYGGIVAGQGNMLLTAGNYNFIGAGVSNTITNASPDVIGGGWMNGITLANYASILGGFTNTIVHSGGAETAHYSAIAGGYQNNITDAHATFIGSGDGNVISAASHHGGILSGDHCTVSGEAAGILNGRECLADGKVSSAMGGYSEATCHGQCVVGNFNTPAVPTVDKDTRNDADPVFTVGNGTSDPIRSNAFQVFQGGNAVLSKGIVINEDSADSDTRIEGNGDANLLFVDAGADRVGIGTGAPQAKLDVVSPDSNSIYMRTASDTATTRPVIKALSARGAIGAETNVTSGKYLGSFLFDGYLAGDSVGASIDAIVESAPNTNVPTYISFQTATAVAARAERLRITSGGNTQAVKTRWKDWGAVDSAHGEVVSFGTENIAGPGLGWYPNAASAAIKLRCTADTLSAFFPIHYEAGTILTRLRVKWQAEGANDGVKVQLTKRVETGTDTAWTVVGAEQTYTDPGAVFPVTVSTYDFADETTVEGTSYRIEVKAVVATTATNLFSVGLETSQRVI